MFLQKAKIGVNSFWLYLLTIGLTVIGYFLGQLPVGLLAMSAAGSLPPDEARRLLEGQDLSVLPHDKNLVFFLLLFMFIFAMAFLYLGVTAIHKKKFINIINAFDRVRWSRVFWAFGFWMFLTLVIEAVLYLMNPAAYEFHFSGSSFFVTLLIALFVLPIQTSWEEIFVRGYLLQGFSLTRVGDKEIYWSVPFILIGVATAYMMNISEGFMAGLFSFFTYLCAIVLVVFVIRFFGSRFNWFSQRWFLVLLTSLIFGSLHGMNPEIAEYGFGAMMFYYITVGAFLAICTLMDDGLELALGIHAATNIYGAVLMTYEGSAIQTSAMFSSDIPNVMLMNVLFVIVSVLFLLIAKRKFGWGSWVKAYGKVLEL
jgi:membrane protease YdiL (CAAX protease family)